jgi:hypothetical protein
LRGQATYLHAVSLLINGTSNMKCNIYTTSHNITTQRMGGSRATLTARARARKARQGKARQGKARQGKASWEIQTHTTSHNITTQRMGGSRATLTARARAQGKARQGKLGNPNPRG